MQGTQAKYDRSRQHTRGALELAFFVFVFLRVGEKAFLLGFRSWTLEEVSEDVEEEEGECWRFFRLGACLLSGGGADDGEDEEEKEEELKEGRSPSTVR